MTDAAKSPQIQRFDIFDYSAVMNVETIRPSMSGHWVRHRDIAPLLTTIKEQAERIAELEGIQKTADSMIADFNHQNVKLSKRIAELVADLEKRTFCGCGTHLYLCCSDIGCDRNKIGIDGIPINQTV